MSARGVQERGEGWGGRREWENRREREELRASLRALACVEDPKSVLRTTPAKAAKPHNIIHVYVCVRARACVGVSTCTHTHTHIIYAISRYSEHVAPTGARNTETRGIQSGERKKDQAANKKDQKTRHQKGATSLPQSE